MGSSADKCYEKPTLINRYLSLNPFAIRNYLMRVQEKEDGISYDLRTEKLHQQKYQKQIEDKLERIKSAIAFHIRKHSHPADVAQRIMAANASSANSNLMEDEEDVNSEDDSEDGIVEVL